MGSESEEKLIGRVRDWLRADGWRTYQEVPLASGRADIVAVRAGLVWVIEGKRSCSIALMGQMLERQRYAGAHGVLAAVPNPSHEFNELCRRLGFGVINAKDGERRYTKPEIVVYPEFYRKAAKNLQKLLARCSEEAADQEGGVSGGSHWTPFKRAVREFVEHFAHNSIERMSVAEAAKLAPIRHYKGEKAEEAALRRWTIWAIEQGLVPGMRTLGRGKDRAVVFEAEHVTDEQRTLYQLRRIPRASPGATGAAERATSDA